MKQPYSPLRLTVVMVPMLFLLQACAYESQYSHSRYDPCFINYSAEYHGEESPETFPKSKPYRVGSTWYYPLLEAEGFRQKGIASWYGEDFHGKYTSSGEPYNMNAMTAAHKELPLGSHVKVTNLKTGQSIVVVVNDRGPFIQGRIIDLSRKAAMRCGVYGPGTAPVEIAVIGSDKRYENGRYTASAAKRRPDTFSGTYRIQVGAFSDPTNAERVRKRLSRVFSYTEVLPLRRNLSSPTLHRVMVGECNSLETAEYYENFLKNSGYDAAFIVME